MRLLLDTHVWLWMLTEPARLGAVEAVLGDPHHELLLSAASTWEIAIKVGLGRLELPAHLETYVPERMRATGAEPLAIEQSHTLEAAELPAIHRDPFDRLLVAQARVLAIPLVTADRRLDAYEVETLQIE